MRDDRTERSGAPTPPAEDSAEFVRHADDDRWAGSARFSLISAFRCAGAGIAYAFTSQRNLKIHLRISEAGWLAVVLCIALVMALELVNTAIESVVDLVSPEWNLLAKRAKDCAAGAVYLAAFASIVVAAIVYLPRLAALVA